MLTQERLKQVLEYNPETGIFTGLTNSSKKINAQIKIGEQVNMFLDNGYNKVRIDRVMYNAHHLAWLYIYGELIRYPEYQIDHINHDRADNRISNLRKVTHQDNHKNRSRNKNNTSGHTGVSWRKQNNQFEVRISGRRLAYTNTLEEGIELRKQAEIELGYHENHGN